MEMRLVFSKLENYSFLFHSLFLRRRALPFLDKRDPLKEPALSLFGGPRDGVAFNKSACRSAGVMEDDRSFFRLGNETGQK